MPSRFPALCLCSWGRTSHGCVETRSSDTGAGVRQVFAEKLPNVPGKSLTAMVVSYARAARPGRITTPEASSPTCSRGRSDRRTPPPARLESTKPATAFSSRPAASISSARMRARQSRRAYWPSSSPKRRRPTHELRPSEPPVHSRWRHESHQGPHATVPILGYLLGVAGMLTRRP